MRLYSKKANRNLIGQKEHDVYLGNNFLNFMDYNPTQYGSENAKLISIKRLGLMKTKP